MWIGRCWCRRWNMRGLRIFDMNEQIAGGIGRAVSISPQPTMTLIQFDPIGLLPEDLKRRLFDSIFDAFADGIEVIVPENRVTPFFQRLRSDAAFNQAIDDGLQRATQRFIQEYMAIDEDLVAAIAREPEFWQTESVRLALMEILKNPSFYLEQERLTLARSFVDVLRHRINRERVDNAVAFYLQCVAEALWHLEPLHPIYELHMQRLNVERATEMVTELRGLRGDVKQLVLEMVQAIDQQRIMPAQEPALPQISPPKVFHNLPQPDHGQFIGREEELKQVHRILRPYPHSQHALVTIDGIGGIGKTTLALGLFLCAQRRD